MRILPILLAMFALCGCSLLPKPADLHDFGLPAVNPTIAGDNPEQAATVTVEAPKWLYDNRIRYRLLYASSTQIRFYALDRWLAPPPELFEQLLTSSNLQSQHPVTVHLLEFEQHFSAPGQAKVLMAFTVDAKSAAKNLVEHRQEFRLQRPSPTPDARGAVAAFSSLTKEAAQQIQNWLNSIK